MSNTWVLSRISSSPGLGIPWKFSFHFYAYGPVSGRPDEPYTQYIFPTMGWRKYEVMELFMFKWMEEVNKRV